MFKCVLHILFQWERGNMGMTHYRGNKTPEFINLAVKEIIELGSSNPNALFQSFQERAESATSVEKENTGYSPSTIYKTTLYTAVYQYVLENFKFYEQIMHGKLSQYPQDTIKSFLVALYERSDDINNLSNIFFNKNVNRMYGTRTLHNYIKKGLQKHNYEDFIFLLTGCHLSSEILLFFKKYRLDFNYLFINTYRTLEESEKSPGLLKGAVRLLFHFFNSKKNVFEDMSREGNITNYDRWFFWNLTRIMFRDIFPVLCYEESLICFDSLPYFRNHILSCFDTFQKQLKTKSNSNDCLYPLEENLAIFLEEIVVQKDIENRINILSFLLNEIDTEAYDNYDSQYDIRILLQNCTDLPQEYLKNNRDLKIVKKIFCESSQIRTSLETFKKRIQVCINIMEWYSQHFSPRVTIKEEWLVLKAIYREVYIYTNTPEKFKRKRLQSFINDITSDKPDTNTSFNEIETFYLLKIERSWMRECDKLSRWIFEKIFLVSYQKKEQEFLNSLQTKNHYLDSYPCLYVDFFKEKEH